MDIAYWIAKPLEEGYVRVLRGKADGRPSYWRPFETAFLIARKCLEKDGLTLTEKGKEALEFYKEIR